MQIAEKDSAEKLQEQTQTIAITATFTAEPIEEPLAFWMQELGLGAAIEFAPYNQVFQQLLDPASVIAQNRQGVNIILLRFEDWQRDHGAELHADSIAAVERTVQDLITALKSAITRSSTPYIVCLCPDSPSFQANPEWVTACQQLETGLVAELSGISGLYLLKSQDLLTYPVEDYYDSQRDRLGHIPFTPVFFTALSTVLARKIYAIKSPPHKVIVLDCDNTIWKGVVGEDGVMGIEISPAYKALQEFMIAQQQAGMILCFCSKNNEPDVLEVFEQRTDMPLKLAHIVTWRINWLPKSENIKSLAQELNLGLDSFIFIDDNPVECAEVQASCPEVLTLQLPVHGDIPQFLTHVWAFDHLKVTEEDQQRTTLYKQNIERERFQREALTIDDFLAALGLTIEISEPTDAQLPRVAQLTQRTNQFNFTTIRRSESEIQQLAQSGLECRVVEVRDRFGDYGLVGVIIFDTEAETLTIDTFLLSCRVLGRGVEHRMLSHLAEIAKERGLGFVQASYVATKKNLPAHNFLEQVAGAFRQTGEGGDRFCLPVEVAAAISYAPGQSQASAEETPSPTKSIQATAAAPSNKSQRLNRIATELQDPAKILQRITSQQRSLRPELAQAFVAPRTEAETVLATLWAELLHLEAVGIQDNYFDLGGTSLLAVEVFARIEQVFHKKLPLTTLLEAPTIEQLAKRIQQVETGDSLVQIRAGGTEPPIFLVHDGDGETMLYRNLAHRLKPEHAVYGLQPHSKDSYPILHTRITEMAAYYVQKVQTLQPQGPYFLGGMCAGGVIAFEMARQLQAQGQEVGLVALMDAADVAAVKRVGRVANIRLQRFSQALGHEQRLSPLKRASTILAIAGRKATNLIVYEIRVRIKRIWNKLKLLLLQYYLDKGLPLPQFLRHLSVRTVYEFAEKQYMPQGRYPGEVVLIRATEGEGSDEPYVEVYSDPLLGWGERVTAGVKVLDVPGGHSSMLQEPHVQVMAEKLQHYIDQHIEQRYPGSTPKQG